MDQSDTSPKKLVGDAIARGRQESGLTQRALAAAMGTDQAKISRYESGANLPGVDVLFEIDRACGRPRGYILRLAGLIDDNDGSAADAIASDTRLTPEVRNAMLTFYQLGVERGPADPVAVTTTELAASRPRPRRRPRSA